MSTPHPTPLDLAISQAAKARLAAERELAAARTRLQSAEMTYSTLDNYRGDYAKRLRSVTQAETPTLGNFHRFLDKLSLALQSQQHDVARAESNVAYQQSGYFESLKRFKAMEQLRSRRAATAMSRQNRQEQKQSDEFAAHTVRRNQRGN